LLLPLPQFQCKACAIPDGSVQISGPGDDLPLCGLSRAGEELNLISNHVVLVSYPGSDGTGLLAAKPLQREDGKRDEKG
jgi:hypothetical protein